MYYEMVELLLKGGKLDLSTSNGKSALDLAVIYFLQDAVDALIKADSNVDIQGQDGRTALIFVADNSVINTNRSLLKLI